MGLKANNIFKSFTFSKPEEGTKYKAVIDKFDFHFLPYQNLIHERLRFFSRNQYNGESAEEYISQLHKLAETCEFKKIDPANIRDELIRDRIVVGIIDFEQSKRFQLQMNLTLAKAVDMVRTYEDTLIQHDEQRPARWAAADTVAVISTLVISVQIKRQSVTNVVAEAIMLYSVGAAVV